MQTIDPDGVSGPADPWPAEIERSAAPNVRQRVFVAWTMDILVYIVVLNLYVEHSRDTTIDSFTLSILTAALLKLLLVAIMAAKSAVWRWAKSKESRLYTTGGVLGVWAIAFFSKFGILEAVDVVFGDRVSFGSFGHVILLVAALLLARELVERVYLWLGRSAAGPRPAP